MSTQSPQLPCLVCQQPLTLRLARGRKSGKAFLMLLCAQDGRHFRGFINDREYVDKVLARLEDQTPVGDNGVDLSDGTTPSRRSKTNLERAG